MNKRFAIACSGGVALLVAAGTAQASCGAAFCVLNTNWSTQGVAAEPGTARLDMHFEFVDQKHLQSGTKRVAQLRRPTIPPTSPSCVPSTATG